MAASRETVFVVDDDEAFCTKLSRVLGSVGLDVRTFSTAEEFLDAYDPEQPGCLLLDVRLPGMSGVELQNVLARIRVEIPIIFISGHGQIQMAVDCLKAGAVDFIEKPFREQALLDCIRKALEKDAAQREYRAAERALEARTSLLTPREREIMNLFVGGKSTKQIAMHLGIRPSTVEVHRTHILEKLEADSLVDLVRIVCLIQNGARHPTPPK